MGGRVPLTARRRSSSDCLIASSTLALLHAEGCELPDRFFGTIAAHQRQARVTAIPVPTSGRYKRKSGISAASATRSFGENGVLGAHNASGRRSALVERSMLLSVAEPRIVASKQKIEILQYACYKPRAVSTDWERDVKARRPQGDYMDTTGTKVDLHHLLGSSFSLGAGPLVSEGYHSKSASAAVRNKTSCKLLPKLASLKRRKRCLSLCLLAELEAKNE